jgi:hypothetical protein
MATGPGVTPSRVPAVSPPDAVLTFGLHRGNGLVSRRQASRKAAGVWFCSELAFAAARQAGISLLGATEPWEVSPGLFARSPLLRWASAGSASGAPSSPSPVPALS